MSTQTASGQSFPTPCKRCGGALYRQVDYCPYCGAANPLDADPHKHTAIPGHYASAMSPSMQKNSLEQETPVESDFPTRAAHVDTPAPADAAARTRALVTPGTSPSLLAEPLHSKGFDGLPVRKVLYAIVAAVAIGLAYGGYSLLSGRDSQSDSGDQAGETTQDARTATGTIALYAPAQPTNQAIAGKPAAQGSSAKPAQAIPAAPAAALAPSVAATPVKPAVPQFRNATQAVQVARLALRTNDLSAAQAALGAAQALQPDNGDAQDLADQLKSLTARRDAALQAAQACVAQSAWPCARQHANDALAIDTGSDSAKTILERVIRETGWAPLNAHASAPGR
ncbi:hypothetical protein A6V36_13475 [Paraburkholderia ginsengiterrae]|uniref:Zinc ribbon domain-containing protein n=1 Tax=Paraburkholderia ginsengiterrae TaxID=1462993 RepID=A0ABX2UKD4_9BURK|nr:hypothetical protein [Paraburkholderia ginsengiterrae]OAJ52423.1 hypothetical protein A6V36_13475 [Paraburkholderia ginsengiterrae]